MKALTLYEMSEQYHFLINDFFYDHETGVIDDTVFEKLNDLQDSIENKCINITKLFKSIELTQKMIKAEKDRLSKRERAFKNQVTRLKEYLQSNMEKCQIKKIECAEFTIGLQNNPIAVEVLNEEEIPHDYDKCQKRELDISKIKEDLQNGIAIQGARLVQRSSVRIR